MIKRVYNSTLHIKKNPCPTVPPTFTVVRTKAAALAALLQHTMLRWKPLLFLLPFAFKVIADLRDKMDESIQVESQSYRDPRYCFFIIVHLHEMDVAASVTEPKPCFFTLAL